MTSYSTAVKGKSILYACPDGAGPMVKEYTVQTVTDMEPGHLVEIDSDADSIKAGADNSVVILGVLDVAPDIQIDATYVAGDQARVLSGHIIVWLEAISGATIAVGTKVQCAGAGKIDQYATATADVGKALQAKTGDDDAWILVEMFA